MDLPVHRSYVVATLLHLHPVVELVVELDCKPLRTDLHHFVHQKPKIQYGNINETFSIYFYKLINC